MVIQVLAEAVDLEVVELDDLTAVVVAVQVGKEIMVLLHLDQIADQHHLMVEEVEEQVRQLHIMHRASVEQVHLVLSQDLQ
jgi:hypothetical protein